MVSECHEDARRGIIAHRALKNSQQLDSQRPSSGGLSHQYFHSNSPAPIGRQYTPKPKPAMVPKPIVCPHAALDSSSDVAVAALVEALLAALPASTALAWATCR